MQMPMASANGNVPRTDSCAVYGMPSSELSCVEN